jgi:hypothetical protein
VACRKLIAEFKQAGLTEGVQFKYLEVPGGTHNEEAWSRRADRMLIYFFAGRNP